ncbi:MAG: hypothetical protein QOJ51_6618 [Acidobacteriaceae bacterium]|nr:hypothetical protein [Acidobacteriaceae bacterium]
MRYKRSLRLRHTFQLTRNFSQIDFFTSSRPRIARSVQTKYDPVKDHPFFDRRNNYLVGRKVGFAPSRTERQTDTLINGVF